MSSLGLNEMERNALIQKLLKKKEKKKKKEKNNKEKSMCLCIIDQE